jgi:hypothetical protein
VPRVVDLFHGDIPHSDPSRPTKASACPLWLYGSNRIMELRVNASAELRAAYHSR